MANITLSRKEKLMKEMNEFFKNSKLTEEDAINFGRKLKKRIHEKLQKR